MKKMDMINTICADMIELKQEEKDRLKTVLIVRLNDYELAPVIQLPSCEVCNNETILERYAIDKLAAGRHKTTIMQYISAVKKFLDITGLNVVDVKADDIIHYIAVKEYRDHISKSYKITIARYLAVFFSWAYRKKYLKEDISLDIEIPKAVQKKKERIDDIEIESMRDACTTLRERALFELLMSTGMRIGEIVNLDISDLDFSKNTVSIYGEKTDTYRTGYLNIRAAKALKAYIQSRNVCSGALFISSKGNFQRLCKSTIEQEAKSIGKRAGVKIKTNVHTYRKTFCSIMYRKTKDILYVSKLMGHSSPEVTSKYYLIDDEEDMSYRFRLAQ